MNILQFSCPVRDYSRSVRRMSCLEIISETIPIVGGVVDLLSLVRLIYYYVKCDFYHKQIIIIITCVYFIDINFNIETESA